MLAPAAILAYIGSKPPGMSTGGQIISAKIAAIAGRQCSRGRVDDLGKAVSELREVAGSWQSVQTSPAASAQ
jgi:hypothetical protein